MGAQQDGGLLEGLRIMASAVGTLLVVLFVVGFFTTGPVFAGIFGGLDKAVAWLVLLAIVAYVGSQTDEFGVGFVFSLVAILLIANRFLPEWLTQPFAFVSETLIGMQLSALNETRMAVLLFATIIAYWAWTVRVYGRGKKPNTIAKRVRIKFEQLGREYFTIGRVAFGLAFALTTIFASQVGELFGEAIFYINNSPVIAGYLATLLGGFGSFIADWPVIGGLDPMLFWAAAAAVFVLVVGVKYNND